MVTVSTIVPAYNASRFIRDTLESALNQDGVRNEVIVIDDGSTDGTPAVLAAFQSRLTTLRQANAGHIAARNRGAGIATGEWLAFLDADDVWLPQKLARQLETAGAQTAVVYTNRYNFGDLDRAASELPAAILHEGDIFQALLFCNFLTLSSAIIRRDWFESVGGFDVAATGCEDWDLWLKIAAGGGTFAVVREPLTGYRLHAQSMTNNQRLMHRGRLVALNRAFDTPRGRLLPLPVRQAALAEAWATSAWFATPWNRLVAAKWFLRAAAYRPLEFRFYQGVVKALVGRG